MDIFQCRRDNLLMLIINRFGGNQTAFAEAVDIKPPQVNRWISRTTRDARNIGERSARSIEQKLALPAGWMDQNHSDEPNTASGEIRGTVPLISWVQAGHWQHVIDELQPGEGERIETTYRARAHSYALRVRGDSMEPRFPEGAILIVEPEEEPCPGKFVIIRQNGDEATFKQLVSDGGRFYLKPLNPRYPILELKDDAVFCGVVKRVEMDV